VAEWPATGRCWLTSSRSSSGWGIRIADAVSLPDQGEMFHSRLELLVPAGRAPSAVLPALEAALAAA
jgi:hypothetical protein